MSQNFELCLSSHYFYVKKRVTFGDFFSLSISTFHKIKTRTYIKILRHASLHLHLKNTCLKLNS